MKSHPLFELAQRTALNPEDLSPPNATYSVRRGVWIDTDSRTLVIRREGEEPPRTKKNDVETGEDQKGY